MNAQDILTPDQIDTALQSLPQWRYQRGALGAVLRSRSSAAALELFAAIGALAQEANHHPDVDWRYDLLFVTLSSHDAGGEVTGRDVSLARGIWAAAERAGARSHPELVRSLELGLDTEDPAAVEATWSAALGYRKGRSGDLVDPYGRLPSLWFQETPTPNANRMHVDIHGALSSSDEVVAAVEQTPCTLDFAAAPQWVVVTDRQGNRLCLCTEAPRGRSPESTAASGGAVPG